MSKQRILRQKKKKEKKVHRSNGEFIFENVSLDEDVVDIRPQ